jgi:hypothetical protein
MARRRNLPSPAIDPQLIKVLQLQASQPPRRLIKPHPASSASIHACVEHVNRSTGAIEEVKATSLRPRFNYSIALVT